MRMTVGEIQDITRARLIRGEPHAVVEGVSTDSRTVRPGNLFVALKGETFDGHDFVDAAIAGGAGAALVDEFRAKETYRPGGAVLAVRDTLTSLGDLAGAYRRRFAMPFIAITGSNGKTTTKEMVAHVLSPNGTLVWAKKSYNNFIGVPLTLFEVVPEAFAVVLELGTSAPGELTRLCEITRPQVGVITNIGPTHLERLKSIEGVAAAKAELLDALGPDDVVILNADDEWSRKVRRLARCKVVTFGAADDADVFARDIRQDSKGLSFTTNGRVRVKLSVAGVHNVHNALAAVAVCRRMGMSAKDIAARLATFAGVPMRTQRMRLGGVTVLNDAYNANPVSMAAALDEFRRFGTSHRRHFVCGDMLELGADSARLHRELGGRIAKSDIDRLWLFGSEVNGTRTGAVDAGFDPDRIFLTDDYATLEAALTDGLRDGDAVLVKGSRGMRLERIVETLRTRS